MFVSIDEIPYTRGPGLSLNMDPDMRRVNFRLHKPSKGFGPRLGLFCLEPTATRAEIKVETPGITVCTSRGVVPHLSRDHVRISQAIKLIDLPFES